MTNAKLNPYGEAIRPKAKGRQKVFDDDSSGQDDYE